jgi:hypothetical protein
VAGAESNSGYVGYDGFEECCVLGVVAMRSSVRMYFTSRATRIANSLHNKSYLLSLNCSFTSGFSFCSSLQPQTTIYYCCWCMAFSSGPNAEDVMHASSEQEKR